MRKFPKLTVAAAVAQIISANAQSAEPLHDLDINEIVVTTNMRQSRADSSVAVNVLDGEALREAVASTLGESLQQLLGVNNSSFGSGVGIPVIRGQSGNRVQVLQSGVSNLDASDFSPDHANSVNAALAQRIEVLRGPATLMYGNGAIGGVVNVIDNRIPQSVPASVTGLLETRHQSALDEQSSVMMLEGGKGDFAWHLDGSYRDSNDTRIDGFAINPDTVDIDDEEVLEELLDSRGSVANTQARSSAASFGFSWRLGDGYIGASYSESEREYGIPAGAHVHVHEDEHEEDHDDEHEEDHADHEEDEHVEHEEGGGNGLTIVMEQSKVDFEAMLPLSGVLNEFNARVTKADYEHLEVEPDGAVGTRYSRDGMEGRFTLSHDSFAGGNGLIGLQVGQESFSAIGEEAYIPHTDIDSAAAFTVQSFDTGPVVYELGLRAEHQHYHVNNSRCDRSDNTISASASGLWRMRDDTNVLLAVTNSQRAPSIEELYSNIDPSTCLPSAELIAHGATGRLEVGLPDAKRERARNIELNVRRHMGRVQGEFNIFYNNIDDYLYLSDTGVEIDELPLAQMRQRDAVFKGVETEVKLPLGREPHAPTNLTLFADYVRAELTTGEYLPRIPALRAGAQIEHLHRDWRYTLRVTSVAKQSRVELNETPSDGYTLVDFSVDYHRPVEFGELTMFAKLSNALDEQVRNHTSVLKDVAPEKGRSVELGLRYSF
ncbi:MAG: TonB-dependent receptor [Pseudohongiellaceae bacterium]|nr:TonB-dependent receptor [Pseudohongiellaceae bacterium]